jgi:basic amino acid/polyamine antiporter, APA family
MQAASSSESHIRPQLSLWDAISIIVGIVVGTSIYRATAPVFDNAGGPWTTLILWLVGGVLAWCGAVCYAELATSYPRDGGDYEYLNRAFGSWCGFLFAWAQITTVISGNIGIVAYAFADYCGRIWPAASQHTIAFALSATLALSALNAFGVVAGKRTQNILTVIKLIGLSGIVIAAAFAPAPIQATSLSAATTTVVAHTNFGLALIFVLYAFGGWTHAAYVAAEVRDQRRNLPRALVSGIVGITLIYLLVNIAYLHTLGFEAARHSSTPAADVLENVCGPWAGRIISLLVVMSALGAINGMILTGTRIYAVWGADYPALSWFGKWNERRAAPIAAIALQAVIATLLILLVGSAAGRDLFDAALKGVGLTPLPWQKFSSGFETLVAGSAPVYWGLCLLTAVAVFVLRIKHPDRERPFQMPLYPFPAILFCATCGYMLYASVDYAGGLSMLGTTPSVE